MLLSRFWYIVLAAAAVLALAAALLAKSVINARYDDNLDTALRRDREVVSALLKLEARERLDRIAFITIDTKVGGLLRQAQGVSDSAKLGELNAGLKEALQGHITSIAEARSVAPATIRRESTRVSARRVRRVGATMWPSPAREKAKLMSWFEKPLTSFKKTGRRGTSAPMTA
jgi:hypothetical protein